MDGLVSMVDLDGWTSLYGGPGWMDKSLWWTWMDGLVSMVDLDGWTSLYGGPG